MFEYDKVFVLNYGEGTVNVSMLKQDDVKIVAFDEYKSTFLAELETSGTDAWSCMILLLMVGILHTFVCNDLIDFSSKDMKS